MAEVAFQQQMITTTCPSCFMEFGVPARFDKDRRNDHQSFYCPAGHSQSYQGRSEEQKLRDQLAEAERRRAFEANGRREAEKQAAQAKNKLKRLTKRVECGVCPHCNRTFKQLAAHMQEKHGTGK